MLSPPSSIPLTLLTASVKAVKEDARKKTAGEAPRPAMFDGLRDEPALASLAASATPVNVAAGEPVATAGEVTGAGAGALFVVARGVASVTTAPDRTRSLGPGDHFGDLVVASGGDAGFPATLTAGPDGVTAYAFPLAAVQTACASCDLARLVVRAAARDTTRRFADVPGAALPRGVDLVLVADALPNANALVHLARDKGAVADTYPHHGTLDGTLEAARALLGDRRAPPRCSPYPARDEANHSPCESSTAKTRPSQVWAETWARTRRNPSNVRSGPPWVNCASLGGVSRWRRLPGRKMTLGPRRKISRRRQRGSQGWR